jgi:hypothetical protein
LPPPLPLAIPIPAPTPAPTTANPTKEEIAVFVEKVFGDRARTKHRLLDEIRRSDGRQITLGLLKPDTKESIPGTTLTLVNSDRGLKKTVPIIIDASKTNTLSLDLN